MDADPVRWREPARWQMNPFRRIHLSDRFPAMLARAAGLLALPAGDYVVPGMLQIEDSHLSFTPEPAVLDKVSRLTRRPFGRNQDEAEPVVERNLALLHWRAGLDALQRADVTGLRRDRLVLTLDHQAALSLTEAIWLDSDNPLGFTPPRDDEPVVEVFLVDDARWWQKTIARNQDYLPRTALSPAEPPTTDSARGISRAEDEA